MNPDLLKKLRNWRRETAKKEGIELFRVLPNRALEDIATYKPKSKAELTSIKGIKDKKFYCYGKQILILVKNSLEQTKNPTKSENRPASFESLVAEIKKNKTVSQIEQKKVYSVSEFLDNLNNKLSSETFKVKGEITSIDEREKVIYFSLKDKDNQSLVNCLIFRYQYEISGVKLEIGNEIVANGYGEIYKPYGRLSLKTNIIELTGEGELKKAYDLLRKKLEKEGLFAMDRKKAMPDLPQTIGLITSLQGAAIGDFTTNLGNYGFKIKFINSSVEGKQAVFNLIQAVKQFQKKNDIDVLAIIRGGGSLESLQAFNNESLVREVAKLQIPVICGVGHDKDISLVSLVADFAVSTPTAAAREISKPWDKVIEILSHQESFLLNIFEKNMQNFAHKIKMLSYEMNFKFENILQSFSDIKKDFENKVEKIKLKIENCRDTVEDNENTIIDKYHQAIIRAKEKISNFEKTINYNNPQRQLRLGYSIISMGNEIIKSVKQVKKGDNINIKTYDGEIKTKVINIKK